MSTSPSQPGSIPAFSCDGSRRRSCHFEKALHLEALNLVILKRNRKGRVLAVEFLPEVGATSSVLSSPHSGTKYVFRERLEGGARCWSLKHSSHLGEE